MKPARSPHLAAILLALAAFSVFSIGDAFIKQLSLHYDIFVIAFYMGAMIMGLVLAGSFFTGGLRPLLTLRDRKWHILRGLCLTVQFLLTIYAFSVMPLTKVYALLFAAPLLTALLAHVLLGERAGRSQYLCIVMGFAGVLVILRPGLIPLDLASAGMLAAAVAFALANIVIRVMKEENQPFLAWPLYTEGMIMLGALPFFLRDPVIPAAPHLLLLLLIAVLSFSGLVMLGMAFRRARATVVAPFHYVQILWAAALGYVLFGDVVDAQTAAGAVLIIGSGLAMIRTADRTPA